MGPWERYQKWLDDDQIDSEAKTELRALADNEGEITERFGQVLAFGTGGMRGKIGVGTNLMNIYNVRLATQALASVWQRNGWSDAGIVIAYDSRRMSQEFAHEAAAVLIGNGIPVYLFDEIAPTPVLSYAVRHHKAGGGIVITASHNPPEYNGYKVYQKEGRQILADLASQISETMERLENRAVAVDADWKDSPKLTRLGETTVSSYLQEVNQLAASVAAPVHDLSVLYTPLHGTGAAFVPRALRQAGFGQVSVVEEQMLPAGGNFPTVASPNPEEPSSFSLAFEQVKAGEADIVLATDPDADRVGVACWNGQSYQLLNGNEIGVLLCGYLLSRYGNTSSKPVIIKTIVTTEMVQAIASHFGAEVMDTLTGFKYICSLVDDLKAQGREYLFGFEESYGYHAGDFVRDKDAVIASVLIAEMAAQYKVDGMTLLDRLQEMRQQFGFFMTRLKNYQFSTSTQAKKAADLIEQWRRAPMKQLAGYEMAEFKDFGASIAYNLEKQTQTEIALPKEDVLQWQSSTLDKVTLRLSGTEPKMKLYIEAAAPTQATAEERLDALELYLDKLISEELA